jgi:hypothetical protein
MNKRHKELAEQTGIGFLYEYEMKWAWLDDLEHFAELVRQDEREACAKLCDIHANNGASFMCAAAIRARGDK